MNADASNNIFSPFDYATPWLQLDEFPVTKWGPADTPHRRERRCRSMMRADWSRVTLTTTTTSVCSTTGYITPKDMLAGPQREIHEERDRKLEAARKMRKAHRWQAA